MNWGTKIAIVYCCFVGLITTLGYMSWNLKTDLVSADYYEKEVKYQEKIDGMKNTQALGEGFSLEKTNGAFVLHYPSLLTGKKMKGEILFYRPSDSDKDERFKAESDAKGTQQLTLKTPTRGLYKIQCDIEVEGSHYYFEEPVQIN
jgi:hypothetical protein